MCKTIQDLYIVKPQSVTTFEVHVFERLTRSRRPIVQVEAAVAAAKEAFPVWSELSPEERSKVLHRLADLIDANLEELAQAESKDQGGGRHSEPRWLSSTCCSSCIHYLAISINFYKGLVRFGKNKIQIII